MEEAAFCILFFSTLYSLTCPEYAFYIQAALASVEAGKDALSYPCSHGKKANTPLPSLTEYRTLLIFTIALSAQWYPLFLVNVRFFLFILTAYILSLYNILLRKGTPV